MKKLLIAILIIAILAISWWLASPLFIDKTVDEALPFQDLTGTEYQEMVEAAEEVEMELPTMEDMQELTQEEIDELEQDMIDHAAEMGAIMVEDAMESGPVVVSSGTFVDADAVHKGSGTASIYENNGEQLLRFEDFSVTNGPDLRVLLARDANNLDAGYIELARLKGNMGNQNYDIPANVDVNDYNHVVIYCKPFHVLFSSAVLQ